MASSSDRDELTSQFVSATGASIERVSQVLSSLVPRFFLLASPHLSVFPFFVLYLGINMLLTYTYNLIGDGLSGL